MLKIFNKINKLLVLFFTTTAYLLVAGVSSVKAIEIAWMYHDMHGEVTGAPNLTDPMHIIVTFLIILAIGLTVWIAKRNAENEKDEVETGSENVLKASP